MTYDWKPGARGTELSPVDGKGSSVVLVGTREEVNGKLLEMLRGNFLSGQALIDVQYLQRRLTVKLSPGRRTERPVRLGRIK